METVKCYKLELGLLGSGKLVVKRLPASYLDTAGLECHILRKIHLILLGFDVCFRICRRCFGQENN